MEFLDFSILNAIIEARKALTETQLYHRLVGYGGPQIAVALARMMRDGLITSQIDGRDTIYGLTRKGFDAQQNYLYASKDPTDTAGIE